MAVRICRPTGVLAVAWVGGEGKSGLIDGNPHQVITQLYGIAVVAVYDAMVRLDTTLVLDVKTRGAAISKKIFGNLN